MEDVNRFVHQWKTWQYAAVVKVSLEFVLLGLLWHGPLVIVAVVDLSLFKYSLSLWFWYSTILLCKWSNKSIFY